jgi:Methyltransferase domain
MNSAKPSLSDLAIRGLDFVAAPAVFLAAMLLRLVRRGGVHRLPACKKALLRVGVFPICDHYYEPLFDGRHLLKPLSEPRVLPGIDWNVAEQLELLSAFHFNDELLRIPEEQQGKRGFYYNNAAFGTGDAEFLYNLIRFKKPKRILEVGSGFSTLIAIEAIAANRLGDPQYRCEHVCIEPYEMPWLEEAPVRVLRERVEKVDPKNFADLESNDVLFIDSSHVIRPQGDVLFEYLEVLPSLKPGVMVHAHDIFSPRDYPASWAIDEVRLWNEQYLLEAFLSHNRDWKILGALNYLHHNHFSDLAAKCPRLKPEREPGSFYLQKIR